MWDRGEFEKVAATAETADGLFEQLGDDFDAGRSWFKTGALKRGLTPRGRPSVPGPHSAKTSGARRSGRRAEPAAGAPNGSRSVLPWTSSVEAGTMQIIGSLQCAGKSRPGRTNRPPAQATRREANKYTRGRARGKGLEFQSSRRRIRRSPAPRSASRPIGGELEPRLIRHLCAGGRPEGTTAGGAVDVPPSRHFDHGSDLDGNRKRRPGRRPKRRRSVRGAARGR